MVTNEYFCPLTVKRLKKSQKLCQILSNVAHYLKPESKVEFIIFRHFLSFWSMTLAGFPGLAFNKMEVLKMLYSVGLTKRLTLTTLLTLFVYQRPVYAFTILTDHISGEW